MHQPHFRGDYGFRSMLDNLGIVQLDSWELPEEDLERTMALARRRLGGASLLEWIARRVTDAQLLDGTVVVLPERDEAACRQLAGLVPPDVPVYFARGETLLARLLAAIEAHPCRGVVLVGITSRLVDPDQIDRLIVSSRGRPISDFIAFRAENCPSSAFPQWCRVAALKRLGQLNAANRPGKSSDMTGAPPAHFRQRWLPLAARPLHRPFELTQPADDDWEYTQMIFDAFGHECFDHPWLASSPAGEAALPAPTAESAGLDNNELFGA
jgi:hypothetical protein